jgi:hypothetical protein
MPRTLPILITLAGALLVTVGASQARAGQPGCQTFPETGKAVCGKFLTYWQEHGGLAQQGFPISNEFHEVSEVNGKTYTVQYFERAVFEIHPENSPPNDVLLSLLGNTFYKQKHPNGAPNQRANTSPGSVLFPETGKRLGGPFLDYWRAHGDLAQQGFPISNEFHEKSDLDGKVYTVQYFERAVFEMHPENKAPYNVLLSQLGTFQLKRKYPGGPPGAASPTPPAEDWDSLRQRPLKIATTTPGGACPLVEARQVAPDFGLAIGSGPLYAVGFSQEATYVYGGAMEEGGWLLLKVLWLSDSSYKGHALVRGRQVDGPGELRFNEGPSPASELRLGTDNAVPSATAGWREWRTYTRLRGPGCYAYQVDAPGFSHLIYFRAVYSSPPP